MSLIVDIADAVVAALNGHTFSQGFTAQRHYAPRFELKDMATLHVTVVPRGLEMSAAGRGLVQHEVQIDLAVQKKLSADTAGDMAEIDALMALVAELADFVRSTRQFGPALWIKTQNLPIYSAEHLAELRQFTSVLTLTLRAIEAAA